MTREFLRSFPPDANVRLAVCGLAYCSLAKGDSRIYFLRHLQNHALQLSVYRRKTFSDVPRVFSNIENTPLPLDNEIEIQTDAPKPTTIFADIAPPEEPLKKVLNLAYYHKNILRRRILPSNFPAPTLLSADNFRFYTLELVGKPHSLWDGAIPVLQDAFFGYSLGGKTEVADGSETLLKIGENRTIALPNQENGERWLYDIVFENDCASGNDKDCVEPDPQDLDFKHYYDVLEDARFNKKLRLTVNRSKRYIRTGACNVVILEPEIEP